MTAIKASMLLVLATLSLSAHALTNLSNPTMTWSLLDTTTKPRLGSFSLKVTNNDNQDSGLLNLELWLFPTKFTCDSDLTGGQKVWQYEMSPLGAGAVREQSGAGNTITNPPTAGQYFGSMLLTEHDDDYAQNGGFRPRFCSTEANSRSWGVPGPPSLEIENGLWWNPAESGTGYTVTVSNGTLVLVIYSFNGDGTPQWYLTSGAMTNGNRNFSGTLDRYRGGQCISCVYNPPITSGNGGRIDVVFHSDRSATLTLPGNRVTTIQPFF